MIIETSSTERNKEYKCFKELYLKRLDVSAKEIKEKFGMGNGKYTTMVKQVKEETGYIRSNRNGVRLIKVKTGVLLSDFRNEKPEDKECKK